MKKDNQIIWQIFLLVAAALATILIISKLSMLIGAGTLLFLALLLLRIGR
jgi:hypothetical protein